PVEPACSSASSSSSSSPSSPRPPARAPKPGKRGAGRRAAKLSAAPPQQQTFGLTTDDVRKKMQELAKLPPDKLPERLAMEKDWLDAVIGLQPRGFPTFLNIFNIKNASSSALETSYSGQEKMYELMAHILLQFGLDNPVNIRDKTNTVVHLMGNAWGMFLFLRLMKIDFFRKNMTASLWLNAPHNDFLPLMKLSLFLTEIKKRYPGDELAWLMNDVDQILLSPPVDMAISLAVIKALQQDDITVFDALLKLGLDKDKVLRDGLSLCHVAARQNAGRILALLLESGANYNAINANGDTPIHLAAENGSFWAFVLICGRDDKPILIKNTMGELPVARAVKNGQWEFIERLAVLSPGLCLEGESRAAFFSNLISEKNIDALVKLRDLNVDIMPAQLIAARDGLLEVIHEMHEKGIDLESEGGGGETVAMVAALYNQVEILKLLHRSGIDISAMNSKNKSPLYRAMHAGHVDVIRALYDLGVNFYERGVSGFELVHEAARLNKSAVLRVLHELDRGQTDILNHVTDSGYTPALIAASNGCTDALKVLHECGVRLDKVDDLRRSVECQAVFDEKISVLELLLELGYSLQKPGDLPHPGLSIAACQGNTDIVLFYLDHGAWLEEEGPNGDTALHVAAEFGQLSVFALLVERGASLSARTTGGFTPTLLAAARGHTHILDFVLERAPDCLQDSFKNGTTIAHIGTTCTGQERILRWLSERVPACNFMQQSDDGYTPAHVAVISCNVPAIKELGRINPAFLRAKDRNGLEPIELAVKHGSFEVFVALAGYVSTEQIMESCALIAVRANHERILKWMAQRGLINLELTGNDDLKKSDSRPSSLHFFRPPGLSDDGHNRASESENPCSMPSL
ncbi:ankyrin repeat domain-containing protein, partial [Legionella sp. CNM-4043-24]|uniref:ankyrin repeat domain-containing protein n=1 Tax=Legionella sp. CNM-4043-24 TaxID=3421646 RepID=UPI00403AFD18